LGHSAAGVGWRLAVGPPVLAVRSPLSGALADHCGSRPVALAGLALLRRGYAAMSTLSTTASAGGFIIRFLGVGLGMGVFQSPNNSAIMGAAPRERLGVISSVLSVTRTLGQTSGIAILGSVWAARVNALSGMPSSASVVAAPAIVQVTAIHQTFLVVVALITFGLGLGIWALVAERRQAQAHLIQTPR